jgi:hypothetical protein
MADGRIGGMGGYSELAEKQFLNLAPSASENSSCDFKKIPATKSDLNPLYIAATKNSPILAYHYAKKAKFAIPHTFLQIS